MPILPKLVLFVAFILGFFIAISAVFRNTKAFQLPDFSVRPSRIETSVNDVSFLVKFTTRSTPQTENYVGVRFGTGFIVDTTPANISINTTLGTLTNWDPECSAALPVIGSTAVAVIARPSQFLPNNEVVFANTDLATDTTYCFIVTSGIDNPSTPGNYPILIDTKELNYNDTVDDAYMLIPIIADDEVNISAAVAPFVRCDASTAGSDNSINLGTIRYGTVTQSGFGFSGGERIYVDGGTNTIEGMSWYYRSDSPHNGLHSATANYTLTGSDSERFLSPTTQTCGPTTPCYGIISTGIFSFESGSVTYDSDFNSAHVGPMTTAIHGERIAYTDGPASGVTLQFWVNATASEQAPAANDYTDTLIFTCKADL